MNYSNTRESRLAVPKGHGRRGPRPMRPFGTAAKRTTVAAVRRRGFSFAEVMFAVVILGIGFIMVAAVFPVAIQQTQSTGEEGTAASIAREAANAIASLPRTVDNPLYDRTYVYDPLTPKPATDYQHVQTELVFPPTVKNYVPGNVNTPQSLVTNTPAAVSAAAPAVVAPFVGPRWDFLKGNLILPHDPRYAYVPFYLRGSGQTDAQLIVVAVTCRQRAIYEPGFDTKPDSSQIQTENITTTSAAFPSAATPPSPGTVPTTIYPDIINITGGYPQEGFYVTTGFGTPPVKPAAPNPAPPWNRTYRLGRQLTGAKFGPGTFEIEAADNMMLTASNTGWGAAGTWDATLILRVNGGIADPAITIPTPAALLPTITLQPTVAYVQLQSSPDSPAGQIAITEDSASTTPARAAAPGAFVIIADDYPFDPSNVVAPTYKLPPNLSLYSSTLPVTTLKYYRVGALNGRIFRLGQKVTKDSTGAPLANSYTYELDPSYGMRPAQPNGPNYSPDTMPNPDFVNYEATPPAVNPIANAGALRAKVFVIGMGMETSQPTPGQVIIEALGGPGFAKYSKTAQDIGVYSTLFQVK